MSINLWKNHPNRRCKVFECTQLADSVYIHCSHFEIKFCRKFVHLHIFSIKYQNIIVYICHKLSEQNQGLWKNACNDHSHTHINFHKFSSCRGLQIQLNNYMSPLNFMDGHSIGSWHPTSVHRLGLVRFRWVNSAISHFFNSRSRVLLSCVSLSHVWLSRV